MVQDSELVTLLFAVAALPVLPLALRGLRLPGLRLFTAGFVWATVGYAATVLEGFFWRDTLEVVEHLSFAVSGLSFLAAVLVLRRAERRPEVEPGR